MTVDNVDQPVIGLDAQLERLQLLCRRLSGAELPALTATDLLEPTRLRTVLAEALGRQVYVTGQAEQRLVMFDGGQEWLIANLGAPSLAQSRWPAWFRDACSLDQHTEWFAETAVPAEVFTRIDRPRLLVAALYHPEYFPLPRFPLGISDVARAARISLCGTVDLLDMQLGDSIDDIVDASTTCDVLGISATFGQHDLEIDLLERIYARPAPPLVIAGGSLTVRNERQLLARFPQMLVARGAGEDTIADVIAYRRGDLTLTDVRGIGYSGSAHGTGTVSIGMRRTRTVPNRDRTDILPELDLLRKTFANHGVAQMEASRGCTNYCSFCPRGHKGSWSGDLDASFEWMVSSVAQVFDRFPELRRTVYLVDEEFIGRGADSVDRALSIARMLKTRGLSWETSCRVDQVVRPDQDQAWHVERAQMWRQLVRSGLKRCLFGVESGVTSILQRFNKETTGDQNALAIRTLSALGVPTRYTYITFDHLMTFEELRQTTEFQARRDLVLRPLPHLTPEEIVEGVRDPEFVRENAVGTPFYTGISYMLVSMECLIGAAYTNLARAAGLTGADRPSMGSTEARFADWRIGVMSRHAQMWIDRNFALDYTMKSLEKILSGEPALAVRGARRVIKDSSLSLLQRMMIEAETFPTDQPGLAPPLEAKIVTLMEEQRESVLKPTVAEALDQTWPHLSADSARVLRAQHEKWTTDVGGWRLINATDSCE